MANEKNGYGKSLNERGEKTKPAQYPSPGIPKQKGSTNGTK